MNNTNENCSNLIIAEPNIIEFKLIVKDIISNPNVLALRERIQHANKSRFYHC